MVPTAPACSCSGCGTIRPPLVAGSQDQSSAVAELAARYGLAADAHGRLIALLDRLSRPEAPTSVHHGRAAVDVHLADSLAGLLVPAVREARTIADLGSGAGLPGLVLAVALPDARVHLIESQARKCAFIAGAATAIGVRNADVTCIRIEEWRAGRERCDVVCARAVAALPVLCEYAAPLLDADGVLVAWKGAVSQEEQDDAEAAAATVGLEAAGVLAVTPFAGSERRTLHLWRKVAATPSGYPRRTGMATKRPLTAKSLRRASNNAVS